MITNKEIQNRLREEIKLSPLSQKQIADKLGVNPSTISRYMNSDKYPSLETFANICKILDISSDDVLGLNEKKR